MRVMLDNFARGRNKKSPYELYNDSAVVVNIQVMPTCIFFTMRVIFDEIGCEVKGNSKASMCHPVHFCFSDSSVLNGENSNIVHPETYEAAEKKRMTGKVKKLHLFF